MDKLKIPITAPGPNWSQREYVAAMKLKDIGFAAHRANNLDQYFHYHFRYAGCCVTLRVGPNSVKDRTDHAFTPTINWINQCRGAIAP